MNSTGWNPAQLVARGVFDSIEQADQVLCRWDEARARSVITPDSWRRGMALDIPISRRRMSSGSAAGQSLPLQDGGPAAECLARPLAITSGPNVIWPAVGPKPMSGPSQGKQSAAPVARDTGAASICPWCAMERATSGQGAAARTGFVSVARCDRHSAESPELLAPQPPTSPPSPALSLAGDGGFLPNPNAAVVQAFPKGRWS